MHNKNKHPLETLFKKIIIPFLITVFFFFYTLYSEPLNTPAGNIIWFLQWMLAVFIGPLLLIIEIIDDSTGPEIDLGSSTWLFKTILQIYYYGMFTILILAVLAEWWLG